MHDAYPAALAASLGLSAHDLAEIGGFTERTARDLLNGARPFQSDVREAIQILQEDVDVITDQLLDDIKSQGRQLIHIYRNKTELRENMRDWPGRGQAAGGFVGPYRIAAITAVDLAAEDGFDVGLVFSNHG